MEPAAFFKLPQAARFSCCRHTALRCPEDWETSITEIQCSCGNQRRRFGVEPDKRQNWRWYRRRKLARGLECLARALQRQRNVDGCVARAFGNAFAHLVDYRQEQCEIHAES